MYEDRPLLEAEMVRIPGLFRRWELSQVLTKQLAFRIEDAGAHEDGTPLLAIYIAGDGHPESDRGNAPIGDAFREIERSRGGVPAQNPALLLSLPQARAALRRA